MNLRRVAFAAVAACAVAACDGERGEKAPSAAAADPVDEVAEGFVRLALSLGRHDKDYVDAYHGPPEWAEAAAAEQRSLEELAAEARRLQTRLETLASNEGDSARLRILDRQLTAALARIRMTQGERLSFDEETRLIYDAVAPQYDLAAFDAVLAEIDALLPGEAPLHERVEAFRNSLAVPPERMQAVFDAAIAECRRRTLAHFDLPENERFRLEFVNDKPWSGYNWYQGDYESLIQINTDLPIVIDRAVDLGCHEGYPGHHTWSSLMERELLKGEGWIEYSVYPLFSPKSVIAEGSANYGIELAFPGEEKIAFERDVLFPLAGLDPAKAETFDRLNNLRRKLSHADNYVAREYLDGRIDKEEAVALLMKYKLSSRERAEQRVRFIETYRGYVVNYNLGRDLVEAYVERAAAQGRDRWDTFGHLLTTPLSASDLAQETQ
ncbi:hypothetical protein [Amphiplicatus metriothermophilus]|uniref:DUF885 domain-containing protein n=1 Tax=Amphiplicatus metriothermophilus TaxID=1519374 RepID=A0A239PXV0_9PROT|nr:hypothetical protein [Amphiplicatus metriothermophilus]MBB5519952.1 hypothetical protein [Amphiplicatus metriothermophilus]SNT74853.1 hypothetical protein SAMN06297382_2443 [Amphiplicatus metriothermophilus]